MSDRNPHSPDQVRPRRLRFAQYVLDQHRGSLLFEGNEIALRPKTFAVLTYLVEHSGRLISKEELFAAVWPNLAITDDVLVQSIGELRRALGGDGARLIKTLPRRGYRFDAQVSTSDFSDPALRVASVAPDEAGTFHSDEATVAIVAPAGRGGRHRLLVLTASFALIASIMLVATMLWTGTGSRGKSVTIVALGGSAAGGNSALVARPAIAVLPLVNQSGDPNAYFADGLTQDIINALGRFSSLTVMSWNAVVPYKGRSAGLEEIRGKLAIGYLVEGNVSRSGDRVRLTTQLVETHRGHVLWSARFDEALTDVFALQDKVTTQIAGALAIRVEQNEQRRVSAKPTDNLEAYDLVLRARPALQHPERAEIAKARTLLRRAIALDPKYASAYAALAESYYIATSMGWAESPTLFIGRAGDFALKAISIDPNEVRARVILGRIDIFLHRYEQAKSELDRAVELNPSDAHGLAGRGNILMWLGKTDKAIESLEQAQRIDPSLNAIDRFALSLAYYLKGRYEAAIEQAKLNLDRTAGANFSRVILAAAYAQANRREDTARVADMIRRSDPTFDPQEFGTKFLNELDLERLRDGLRKAGLFGQASGRG